jgi:hypothetical protein
MNRVNSNQMITTLPADSLVRQPHPVKQVTLLSKYLALGLFVALPFMGAYVGYQFAPVQNIPTVVFAPAPVTSTQTSTTTVSEKTSPEVLMLPMAETDQIQFFNRTESEGSIKITFVPNYEFEKTNGDVVFKGSLKFEPSDYSGTWVGYFTPNEETVRMLPDGEPEGLPQYFYIVDPDTVNVLCDSFDCENYTTGKVYTADVSFPVESVTYETYNSGFGSYPKTLTFNKVEIIPPTN